MLVRISLLLLVAFFFWATDSRLLSAQGKRTFTAFSFATAEARAKDILAKGGRLHDDRQLWMLGGITRPWAIVKLKETEELILVGERFPDGAALTIDHWSVSLRSRYIYPDIDPGVSIDPDSSSGAPATQLVTFSGGIDSTAFGEVCYAADWLMKRIGLNLEPLVPPGLQTFFSLAIASGSSTQVNSRFMFHPILNRVSVIEGLTLLESFQMGVFTETLSVTLDGSPVADPGAFFDETSRRFAQSFTDHYDDLAKLHSSLATLRELTRLSGLAKGLAETTSPDEISFWLKDFPVQAIAIPDRVPVLSQEDRSGNRVSGGVQLSALAMRLAKGDASAFREIVAATRPSQAMVWDFAVEMAGTRPAGIEFTSEAEDPRQLGLLWNQVQFLTKRRDYDSALSVLNDLIELSPKSEMLLNERASLLNALGRADDAIADSESALALNPKSSLAYLNLGSTKAILGRFDASLADLTQAIQLNPWLARAHLVRADVWGSLRMADQEFSDISRAAALSPESPLPLVARARFYARRGNGGASLKDLEAALRKDPELGDAYLVRAAVMEERGERQKALEDYVKYLTTAHGSSDFSEQATAAIQRLRQELQLPSLYESDHGNVGLQRRLERFSRPKPKSAKE